MTAPSTETSSLAGSEPLPCLCSTVVITSPTDGGTQHVVSDGASGRYFRLGDDAVRVLTALDGKRDAKAVAELLGPPFTEAVVRHVVGSFRGNGLLEGADDVTKKPRRLRWQPPFNVQYTVLDQRHFPPWVRRILGACGGRRARRFVVSLVLLGMLGSALNESVLFDSWTTPVNLWTFLAVIGAMTIVTSIHELAHASVLVAEGGTPTRLGVMLFYLAPAFFCDVSDSWRLSDRRLRVHIALAGVTINAVVAGLAGTIAGFVGNPDVRQALALLAAMNLLTAVLNVIPFIKLDGYLALMCHLDEPHLRRRAITDARKWLAHLVGAPCQPRALDRSWSIPFGLAAGLLPVLLVGAAANQYVPLLLDIGWIGGALTLLAITYFVFLGLRVFTRFVLDVRHLGATSIRIGVSLAVVVGLVFAILLVPMERRLPGGYVVDATGHGRLFVAESKGLPPLRSGEVVQLRTPGALVQVKRGSALTNGLEARKIVRVEDVFPFKNASAPIRVRSIDLTQISSGAPAHGSAVVRVGTTSFGSLIFHKFVLPAVQNL